jgi:hypothetical protein
MKLRIVLILLVSFLPAWGVLAQDTPSAAESAENLRSQLRDVQSRETELQLRVQQLDWDLKSENIERYFAGVGTTRPEELREQRRRQLQLQKEGVLAQLDQLTTSRLNLEASISTADAQAYQQSATDTQFAQMLEAGSPLCTPCLVGLVAVIAFVGALGMFVIITRKL